jgi:transposase-like protein
MSHPGTHGLAEARKRDSEHRRARVLAVLAEVTAANTEVSVATVARKAGVSRSFIHRHRDLHREVRAAEQQRAPARGTAAVSAASLRADLANLREQNRRLLSQVRLLESRLSDAFGAQVLGGHGSADHPDNSPRTGELEREVRDLRADLRRRDDELAAARAANRELLVELNRK